jgi:hypothetical protein
MSYLGREPAIGTFRKIDSIRGLQNGERTAFPINVSNHPDTPDNVTQWLVVKNGVALEPGEDFSVNGVIISIVPAPQSNDIIWIVSYGQPRFTGVPSDGTVTTEKIADAAVGYDKLSGDTISTIIGNIVTFGI